jgi:hypothetical protein
MHQSRDHAERAPRAAVCDDSLMPRSQDMSFKDNATLRKRLAKKMAHDCFRNAKKLKDMHAADRFSDCVVC